MAVLRSCYTTTGRLHQGGPPVTIRWYFAAPDAPIYDGLSCWEPELYWNGWEPRPDEPGELPGAKRYWYNGANPGVQDRPHWCGTEEDFRGNGERPLLPNGRVDFGRLCSCAIVPCIGWGPSSVVTRVYKGDLAFDGEGSVSVTFGASGLGELACEGQGSASVTFGASGLGELACEGEATVAFNTGLYFPGDLEFQGDGESSYNGILEGVGDLAMECEFFVGESPDGSYLGDLVFEAETAEGESPDGSYDGAIGFECEWVDDFGDLVEGVGELVLENDIPDLEIVGVIPDDV